MGDFGQAAASVGQWAGYVVWILLLFISASTILITLPGGWIALGLALLYDLFHGIFMVSWLVRHRSPNATLVMLRQVPRTAIFTDIIHDLDSVSNAIDLYIGLYLLWHADWKAAMEPQLPVFLVKCIDKYVGEHG